MEISQVKSKFLNGSFDQNTYVVTDEKFAVIIDAGANIEDLKTIINERQVLAVLITHIHFDHIYYLESILKEFNCPVYIQSDFSDKFFNSYKNVSYIVGENLTFNIDRDSIKFYQNDLILENFNFQVIETPGHSEDSVCLKIGENLFTGDTVFYGSIGRTDFYDGSNMEIIKSLKTIYNLNFSTAYPGHGNICTRDEIIETINMFI